MRANKWIPIVEAMPEINQVILLEFGGNEYLGPPHHTVVLPAYLTQCKQYWIIFTAPDSPYSSYMAVSSTHIWTELPMDSCEIVYWENNL
jgi:hypothetical protein